ncbi:hypothetical protein GGR52DRAFT_571396 [Hypoxylon sp. FL1284]|nr:hypothetical protein GGR52DRAFT_571396 [Hypoxylon sp. FL1284]
MRDEPMFDEPMFRHHQPPWRPEMPHISIPIQTINNNARPNAQSPSLTTVSLPGTTGFVLGADTCGFTTSSTIACDSGYECSNVGGHRGCCSPGDEDCTSTIYTECINYNEMEVSEDCGANTLCCQQTNPSCFTYAFSTKQNPGVTRTYVQCNPSEGFGEMFPFPPELMTTTSSSETSSDTKMSGDEQSSTHSTSTGAIVGAVVGSVAFVALVIAAAALIFCRRRRNRQRAGLNTAAARSGAANTPQNSADVSPVSEKDQAQAAAVAAKTTRSQARTRRSLLRPLSLIREQPRPVITPVVVTDAASEPKPARDKHETTTAVAARQSFGPNWPLGPAGVSGDGSSSNNNPLRAHPVDAALKKRLSDSRLGVRMPGDSIGHQLQPILQSPRSPAPPPATLPPCTRPAPLNLSSPRSPRGGGSPSPATPALRLQSPRLSYVPVSPIEAVAFGTDVSRALDQVGRGDGTSATAAATSMKRFQSAAHRQQQQQQQQQKRQTAEPVSPIDSDRDGSDGGYVDEDARRVSYVSAPSPPGDRELVSPVSADMVGIDGEGGIPGPVSPLSRSRPRSRGI